MIQTTYATRGPEFEELPTTVVTQVPHVIRKKKHCELAVTLDAHEPTLLSSTSDAPPATVRMPRTSWSHAPAHASTSIATAPRAPMPSEPSICAPLPHTPMATIPPPPSSRDVRRVEHVIVGAASGWLQFVLGALVAITVAATVYLVLESWHPRALRVVSLHVPTTIVTRADAVVRGRAPSRPLLPARPGRPSHGVAPAPEREVTPESILDDGLVASRTEPRLSGS